MKKSLDFHSRIQQRKNQDKSRVLQLHYVNGCCFTFNNYLLAAGEALLQTLWCWPQNLRLLRSRLFLESQHLQGLAHFSQPQLRKRPKLRAAAKHSQQHQHLALSLFLCTLELQDHSSGGEGAAAAADAAAGVVLRLHGHAAHPPQLLNQRELLYYKRLDLQAFKIFICNLNRVELNVILRTAAD